MVLPKLLRGILSTDALDNLLAARVLVCWTQAYQHSRLGARGGYLEDVWSTAKLTLELCHIEDLALDDKPQALGFSMARNVLCSIRFRHVGVYSAERVVGVL